MPTEHGTSRLESSLLQSAVSRGTAIAGTAHRVAGTLESAGNAAGHDGGDQGAASRFKPGSPWRVNEVRILCEVYPSQGLHAVHRLLPHRTICAISKAAMDHGLRRENRWTTAEDEVLRGVYPWQGVAGVQQRLRRDAQSIKYRAHFLGLRRDRRWLPEHDALLREHYPDGGVEAVMRLLPWLARNTILCRARKLRVVRTKLTRKRWSAYEDGLIRVHFPDGGTKTCLRLLPGRTGLAIVQRAYILGVRRTGKGKK